MNEPQSELPPVHEAALAKLSMIAGEYFDHYLIIVSKGNDNFDSYSNDRMAHGMSSWIHSKINKKWWGEEGKKIK